MKRKDKLGKLIEYMYLFVGILAMLFGVLLFVPSALFLVGFAYLPFSFLLLLLGICMWIGGIALFIKFWEED